MNQKSAKQVEAIAGERFQSVRRSHAKETAEDYVEADADVLQRKRNLPWRRSCEGVLCIASDGIQDHGSIADRGARIL